MKTRPPLTQERADALFIELVAKPQLRKEAAVNLHAFLAKRFALPKRVNAALARLSRKQFLAIGKHINNVGGHNFFIIDVRGLTSTSPPVATELKFLINLRCTTTTVETSYTTWDEEGNSHTRTSHSSTTTCEVTGFTVSWD